MKHHCSFLILGILPLVTSEPMSTEALYFPLYGSVYTTAYWFADVYLGAPNPQKQSLIVDTGSSVLGFACTGCSESCGKHIDPPFDISESKTIKSINCQEGCILCSSHKRGMPHSTRDYCAYHIEYVEGSSLTGRWYQDILWGFEYSYNHHLIDMKNLKINFSNSPHITTPIGCHYEETQQFQKQLASGILGLEVQSHYGPQTFLESAFSSMFFPNFQNNPRKKSATFEKLQLHAIPSSSELQPQFALCLSDSGGVFAVGKSNSKYHVLNEVKLSEQIKKKSVKNYQPSQFNVRDSNNINPNFFSNNALKKNPSFSNTSSIVPRYLYEKFPLLYAPKFPEHVDFKLTFTNYDENEEQKQDLLLRTKIVEQNNYDKTAKQPTIQWTPMVSLVDSKEFDGSYVILLKKLSVSHPSFENPYFVQLPTIQTPALGNLKKMVTHTFRHNGTTTMQGLYGLVDSGTTLSHFPFLLYASLVVQILKHMMQSITVQEEISKTKTAPRRISGTPLLFMEKLVSHEYERLKNEEKELNTQEIIFSENVLERTLSKSHMQQLFSNTASISQDFPLYNDQINKITSQKSTISTSLETAKRLMHEINELIATLSKKKKKNTKKDGYRTLVDKIKNNFFFFSEQNSPSNIDTFMTPIPDSNFEETSKFRQPRRLAEESQIGLKEECWRLELLNSDFQYFPVLNLEFADSALYKWRPKAYLYRRGITKFYCLTLVSKTSPGEEHTLYEVEDTKFTSQSMSNRNFTTNHENLPHASKTLTNRSAQTLNLNYRRQLQTEIKDSIVFGSTFFIDHDMIFHLGNWSLGFAEAFCPTTKITDRIDKTF